MAYSSLSFCSRRQVSQSPGSNLVLARLCETWIPQIEIPDMGGDSRGVMGYPMTAIVPFLRAVCTTYCADQVLQLLGVPVMRYPGS